MNIAQIINKTELLFKDISDPNDLYGKFSIPKKNGYRTIHAPCKELKYLQKQFYYFLLSKYKHRYRFPSCTDFSHGFIKERGIISNSITHLYTLANKNLDIPNDSKVTYTKNIINKLRRNRLSNPINKLEKKSVLIKLDIKQAFDTVTTYKLKGFLTKLFNRVIIKDPSIAPVAYALKGSNKFEPYCEKIINILLQLISLNGCLPQGAPSSPMILNILLYKFQSNLYHKLRSTETINKFTKKTDLNQIQLSCYADDIAISFLLEKEGWIDKKKVSSLVEYELSKFGFKLNYKKTKLFTIKHGFKVTGITLSNSGLTLSRKKYYNLKARINNYIKDTMFLGKETEGQKKEFESIYGQLSFLASVDVSKAISLKKFYFKRIDKKTLDAETKNEINGLNILRLKNILLEKLTYSDLSHYKLKERKY